MKKPIQISIPTPCHENWDAMTPADKGRFCASCQKTVIDFSNASDREIAHAYINKTTTCGRFRADQLNRDLILPQEKSSIWMTASAAIISFLGLGTHSLSAQTLSVSQEKHAVDNKSVSPESKSDSAKKIKGKITDQEGTPLEGVKVRNKTTGIIVNTDKNGKYAITATIGDVLETQMDGYINQAVVFDGKMEIIALEKIEPILMIYGGMG